MKRFEKIYRWDAEEKIREGSRVYLLYFDEEKSDLALKLANDMKVSEWVNIDDQAEFYEVKEVPNGK